ncbi:MAG TPA: hypothetical protein VMB21_21780 [Candidatus Limnocylindria bacterium]|nr:hypothetical protein [Candidatus Limnocylindria bacterium]
MKPFLPAFVVLCLLTGCATYEQHLVLEPVGPSTELVPAAGVNGSLVVYSAFDGRLLASRDGDHRRYSSYRLLAAGEDHPRVIDNDSGTAWEGPVSIELPAGSYRVVAPANGFGTVTVPVVIAAGRVTTVHLEGGDPWPSKSLFTASNAVRLPDGQVVGLRAPAQ